MEGKIVVFVLVALATAGQVLGLPAPDAGNAPTSGYLNMHPLVAIHSSYPNSAYIPLSAPPPPNLVTYETVEHMPRWPLLLETRGLAPLAPASQLDFSSAPYPLAWTPYGPLSAFNRFAKHSDISPKGIAFQDLSNNPTRKIYDLPISLFRPEPSTTPVLKMDPNVAIVSRSTLSTEQVALPISSFLPVIAIPAAATVPNVEEKTINPSLEQQKDADKVTYLNDFVFGDGDVSLRTRKVREAPTPDHHDDLIRVPLTAAPLFTDTPLPLISQHSSPEEVPSTSRSARQSNIAVVPLPEGVKPFQGFIKPLTKPLPPPPPPPPSESQPISRPNPSEIFVVNPEESVQATAQASSQVSFNPETTQYPQQQNPQPQGTVNPGNTDYYHQSMHKDGSYTFQYEYGDTSRHEWGFLRTFPGQDTPVLVKEGYYTYSGADGALYRVDYVADDGGFRIRTSPLRRREQ